MPIVVIIGTLVDATDTYSNVASDRDGSAALRSPDRAFYCRRGMRLLNLIAADAKYQQLNRPVLNKIVSRFALVRSRLEVV